MKKVFQNLGTYIALAVVLGAFVWSAVVIYTRRAEETAPDTITLRISHWQLEAGVRDAFNELAAEYQKLHPNVRIVQEAIPESTYGQWVSTQLIGGTAPDMVEMGILPWHLIVSYYNRYFLPLTRYVEQPNPYNAGTEFADTPLRETYKDGMRAAYIQELQEYMTIPLSQFGVRVFYNKTLLKELTGLDELPSELRAFLDVCDTISQNKNEANENYIPIAGSRFHIAMWESFLFEPLTYSVLRRADFNRDGDVSTTETFVAFKTERVTFAHPAVKARLTLLRDITTYFQPGYTGLTRDEAMFLFAQQRAVITCTGTWDVRSVAKQAEGRFEVAVAQFPAPTPDDPVYGPLMEGPIYEESSWGFPFAIPRTCKHPEVALDFLLFLSSRQGNERLNKVIGWIPAIRGAKMDPLLEEFEPNTYGMYRAVNFQLGGETWVKWLQLYALYQVNQISYEDFADQFGTYYVEQGYEDYKEITKDWRRGIVINEQVLAGFRAKAMESEGAEAESQWIKYRGLMAARQVWAEVWHNDEANMVDEGPELNAPGPYEYSPELLERVRARVAAEMRAEDAGE